LANAGVEIASATNSKQKSFPRPIILLSPMTPAALIARCPPIDLKASRCSVVASYIAEFDQGQLFRASERCAELRTSAIEAPCMRSSPNNDSAAVNAKPAIIAELRRYRRQTILLRSLDASLSRNAASLTAKMSSSIQIEIPAPLVRQGTDSGVTVMRHAGGCLAHLETGTIKAYGGLIENRPGCFSTLKNRCSSSVAETDDLDLKAFATA
jgi:hypothetical protein